MNEITIADARNRPSELVRRAEAGEEVVVTRRGRPVARLIGASDKAPDRRRIQDAFDHLARLRRGKIMEGDLKAVARTGLD